LGVGSQGSQAVLGSTLSSEVRSAMMKPRVSVGGVLPKPSTTARMPAFHFSGGCKMSSSHHDELVGFLQQKNRDPPKKLSEEMHFPGRRRH
jgi:hypothetical protein